MKTVRFKTLIKQHGNWIFTYAYYFTGDHEDAEDISQEVMLRIWQNIERIKFGSAKAWIRKTTRNLCIDFVRRKKAFSQRIERASRESLEAAETDLPAANPFEIAHGELLQGHIARALLKLPEKQKSILILREIQDLSYKEISDTLGLPMNTIKVTLLRARVALRTLLFETLKGELQNVT